LVDLLVFSLPWPAANSRRITAGGCAGESRHFGGHPYVAVWAYCLMPNHVQLILKLPRIGDLGRAVGEAHQRSTNFISARGRWIPIVKLSMARINRHKAS